MQYEFPTINRHKPPGRQNRKLYVIIKPRFPWHPCKYLNGLTCRRCIARAYKYTLVYTGNSNLWSKRYDYRRNIPYRCARAIHNVVWHRIPGIRYVNCIYNNTRDTRAIPAFTPHLLGARNLIFADRPRTNNNSDVTRYLPDPGR